MHGDTCNAVKRVANKQFICTLETGHHRKLETPHRDGDFTWTDAKIGGEQEREF